MLSHKSDHPYLYEITHPYNTHELWWDQVWSDERERWREESRTEEVSGGSASLIYGGPPKQPVGLVFSVPWSPVRSHMGGTNDTQYSFHFNVKNWVEMNLDQMTTPFLSCVCLLPWDSLDISLPLYSYLTSQRSALSQIFLTLETDFLSSNCWPNSHPPLSHIWFLAEDTLCCPGFERRLFQTLLWQSLTHVCVSDGCVWFCCWDNNNRIKLYWMLFMHISCDLSTVIHSLIPNYLN